MCCTIFGYALRIYLAAVYVLIQAVLHLAVIIICHQMYWCFVLPKPHYFKMVPMFTYMIYFFKRECVNLTEMGFPPYYKSAPDVMYVKPERPFPTLYPISTITPPPSHMYNFTPALEAYARRLQNLDDISKLARALSLNPQVPSYQKPSLDALQNMPENAPAKRLWFLPTWPEDRDYPTLPKVPAFTVPTLPKFFFPTWTPNFFWPTLSLPDWLYLPSLPSWIKFPTFPYLFFPTLPRIFFPTIPEWTRDFGYKWFPGIWPLWPNVSWWWPTWPPWATNPAWATRPSWVTIPPWLKNWLGKYKWFPWFKTTLIPDWWAMFNMTTARGGLTFDPFAPLPVRTKIQWPERTRALRYTYDWILAYLIMDSVWIFSTLVLVLGAIFRVRGVASIFFYLPFILATTTLCIMDIVAATYYGITIAYTLSWFDFLKFMGVLNMHEVRNPTLMSFPDYHNRYTYPAIFATLFFSRFLLFWILNLITLCSIIHIFRRVLNQKVVHKNIVINKVPRPCPPPTCPPPICPPYPVDSCGGYMPVDSCYI